VQVIDAHTHVVPQRLEAQPARDRLWPTLEHRDGGHAAVVIAGKVFRELDTRSWDVTRRREDMDAEGVDAQILSPMPELLSHWLPADDADHLSQIMNEQIAAMIAAAPKHFHGLGMVPIQDVELAIKRLSDIRALGLCGVEIGTHINGIPLGDIRLMPFYAAAEALDLSIFVHPLHPTGLDRIGGTRELGAVASFPLETAFAAVSLLGGRVLEQFPKLRILLSHGGGAFPWINPRIDHVWSMGTALHKSLPQAPREVMREFWYDTILYDHNALRYLAARVGSSQLVIGSDYPFTIYQRRPGAFATDALGADAPFRDNTIALLGAKNIAGLTGGER
jgi:aminocarboxymuconate-semialdehyde decarboxylase